MKGIHLVQDKDIRNYKPILEGLVADFDYIFYGSMLTWCGVIESKSASKDYFWEVWLIYLDDKVVGVCGLYSLRRDSTEELWLGWFGLVPEQRGKKIGEIVLKLLEQNAVKFGAKRLYTYVAEVGTPLPFYYRNGFKKIGTALEFCNENFYSMEEFQDADDHILLKNLESTLT